MDYPLSIDGRRKLSLPRGELRNLGFIILPVGNDRGMFHAPTTAVRR